MSIIFEELFSPLLLARLLSPFLLLPLLSASKPDLSGLTIINLMEGIEGRVMVN
jgi:hypothetical protein